MFILWFLYSWYFISLTSWMFVSKFVPWTLSLLLTLCIINNSPFLSHWVTKLHYFSLWERKKVFFFYHLLLFLPCFKCILMYTFILFKILTFLHKDKETKLWKYTALGNFKYNELNVAEIIIRCSIRENNKVQF